MSTILMLEMTAAMSSKEEMVDGLIDDLQKFKDGGFKEEDEPHMNLILLIVKLKQGNMSLEDTMKMAFEHNKMIKKFEKTVSIPIGKEAKA